MEIEESTLTWQRTKGLSEAVGRAERRNGQTPATERHRGSELHGPDGAVQNGDTLGHPLTASHPVACPQSTQIELCFPDRLTKK